MNAFVFPGQGAQFVGMGKDLYEKHPIAKQFFEKANDILGFRITDIMFNGTDEELKQTKVTQPAMFLHSVVSALCLGSDFQPAMVAGHSLGELSALTAARCLSFEDGLKLVAARAKAMQKACEAQPGTMAAIIALADEKVEEVCAEVRKETGKVVTVEEHSIIGGLGGAVCECLAEKAPVPVKRIGINDVFGESGPAVALLEKYGLDAEGIYKQIKEFA